MDNFKLVKVFILPDEVLGNFWKSVPDWVRSGYYHPWRIIPGECQQDLFDNKEYDEITEQVYLVNRWLLANGAKESEGVLIKT